VTKRSAQCQWWPGHCDSSDVLVLKLWSTNIAPTQNGRPLLLWKKRTQFWNMYMSRTEPKLCSYIRRRPNSRTTVLARTSIILPTERISTLQRRIERVGAMRCKPAKTGAVEHGGRVICIVVSRYQVRTREDKLRGLCSVCCCETSSAELARTF
jgi:hypothetical protein